MNGSAKEPDLQTMTAVGKVLVTDGSTALLLGLLGYSATKLWNTAGRIINITSSAVKAPIAELALSNGARSGLTGFVAGLARQTVASNVTINNMLPGRFWTDRLKSNTEFNAKEKGKTVEEVKRDLEKAIPAGRFGTPEEFGDLCASARASTSPRYRPCWLP